MNFTTKVRLNSGTVAWYLLPTIRFGVFVHWKRGGFLAFTWLKFDACVMWDG